MHIYVIICDNVTYAGFRIIHEQDTYLRRSCDILVQFTTSTPLKKDTRVFKSCGRFLTSCFIGLMCHNYTLNLCIMYIYTYVYVCLSVKPIKISRSNLSSSKIRSSQNSPTSTAIATNTQIVGS